MFVEKFMNVLKNLSELSTVVPGFRVLGFRALPGFRAHVPGSNMNLCYKFTWI